MSAKTHEFIAIYTGTLISIGAISYVVFQLLNAATYPIIA